MRFEVGNTYTSRTNNRANRSGNLNLHATVGGNHDLRREACAALGATGCQDAAASACAHPSPETVGLCPAAGIRLERALHDSPIYYVITRTETEHSGEALCHSAG